MSHLKKIRISRVFFHFCKILVKSNDWYFLKICFHEFLLLHFPGMQNRFGGYENDCSVARLQDNRFMLMSPSIQQMKAYTWMRNHLPSNGSVDLQDVTSLYTSLCVLG